MPRRLAVSLLFAFALIAGCGKTGEQKNYTPPELTEEEIKTQQELSAYADEFKRAFAASEDYVQVAIVDRATKFPEDDRTYSRVLVLMREQLDLDDFGLSLPGKEQSEERTDRVAGYFNDVMFWVDRDGQVFIDDYDQPPGAEMVVEWCVENVPGNKVSLHYGGNPCVVIDLAGSPN